MRKFFLYRAYALTAMLASLGVYLLAEIFSRRIAIPSQITAGPVTIHFYSLILAIAVIAAFLLAGSRRQEAGIEERDLENIFLAALVSGMAGARIHHVLSQWSYYAASPLEIFKLWHGGLGIYGGIAAGGLAVFAYAKARRINFLALADLLAPSLALAQAIGRWGNFFNQEAYGLPTSLPWKMYIDVQHRIAGYAEYAYFHPLFLYESLWNLLVVFVLLRASRKKRKGEIFAWYLILYSLGRFWIEPLRADISLIGAVPLNQVLALAASCAGAGILLYIKYIMKFSACEKLDNLV